MSSSSSTA